MLKEQTVPYASKPALMPAAEWFVGGRPIPYDPDRHRVLTTHDAITRRDGAAFLHNGARFVDEHKAHDTRWNLARLYHALSGSVEFCIAGSTEDPYEPSQIAAARTRLGAAGLDIRMCPGGHLTASEHPDLLAAVIHERAMAWLQP